MTEEDRAKHWQDIWQCRKALVEHKMLRRPPDTSGGFLTTTLRRYNRAKMEALQRQKEENFMKDFDKVFKQSYWSYSKSMLKQPLSVMEEPEMDEVALKMFHSLLLHAGIQLSYSDVLVWLVPYCRCATVLLYVSVCVLCACVCVLLCFSVSV